MTSVAFIDENAPVDHDLQLLLLPPNRRAGKSHWATGALVIDFQNGVYAWRDTFFWIVPPEYKKKTGKTRGREKIEQLNNSPNKLLTHSLTQYLTNYFFENETKNRYKNS